MIVKDFFRKQALRKWSSKIPTAIIPLSEVKTAVAFLDVEDTSFDDCKVALTSYFKANNIRGEIFYFDFRRIGSDELLITSITNTVLRKDINWYGKPSDEKLALLDSIEPDMLISLIGNEIFTCEFAARYCKARFKVGRYQLSDRTFDLVVGDPSDRKLLQIESFEGIKQFIDKIR